MSHGYTRKIFGGIRQFTVKEGITGRVRVLGLVHQLHALLGGVQNSCLFVGCMLSAAPAKEHFEINFEADQFILPKDDEVARET